MNPVIREAVSPEDRGRVFRFRYAVYVEEMNRVQKHADHVRRAIEEPFDATGRILMAEVDGEVVGTVRTNFARETDLGYYVPLFRLDSVGDAFPEAVSLTTKLMVARSHRSGTLGVRLAQALFDHGRVRGIRHDFIDCNAHLEAFFQRLGFRQYMPKVVHPEYGEVLPLRLDVEDEDHLVACRSPLAGRTGHPRASRTRSAASPLANPL